MLISIKPNASSFLFAYQVNNLSPAWKELLDAVGVTERQLKDQGTMSFIHGFVDQHGGIEEAIRQLEARKRETPPSSALTSNTSSSPSAYRSARSLSMRVQSKSASSSPLVRRNTGIYSMLPFQRKGSIVVPIFFSTGSGRQQYLFFPNCEATAPRVISPHPHPPQLQPQLHHNMLFLPILLPTCVPL